MDLLSNLISIIKNGYNLRVRSVNVPKSSLCIKVLSILYRLGYIQGFVIKDNYKITVHLKYINNKPCIRNISRVSTPGKRVYMSIKKFSLVLKKKDNGFFIFSTSRGILTDEEALLFNIGGEILIKVN